mgnify:CR=1 FL=1
MRLNNLMESDLVSALGQINLSIPENDSAIYSLLGSGSVGNSIRLLEHDGANLYRTLLSFLNQLPNLSGFELEKFIGTLSGNKNRSRLELFIELLNMVIARISKAGIAGFTKALAVELASDKIRVNGIAPGLIWTAQALDPVHSMGPKMLKAAASGVPLKRIGTAQDIANTISFLISDKASYITGQIITVDGGLTGAL